MTLITVITIRNRRGINVGDGCIDVGSRFTLFFDFLWPIDISNCPMTLITVITIRNRRGINVGTGCIYVVPFISIFEHCRSR